MRTDKPTPVLVFFDILYLLAALIAMFLIKATELQIRWCANSVLVTDEERAASMKKNEYETF
jgi:hypothetical protein